MRRSERTSTRYVGWNCAARQAPLSCKRISPPAHALRGTASRLSTWSIGISSFATLGPLPRPVICDPIQPVEPTFTLCMPQLGEGQLSLPPQRYVFLKRLLQMPQDFVLVEVHGHVWQRSDRWAARPTIVACKAPSDPLCSRRGRPAAQPSPRAGARGAGP